MGIAAIRAQFLLILSLEPLSQKPTGSRAPMSDSVTKLIYNRLLLFRIRRHQYFRKINDSSGEIGKSRCSWVTSESYKMGAPPLVKMELRAYLDVPGS